MPRVNPPNVGPVKIFSEQKTDEEDKIKMDKDVPIEKEKENRFPGYVCGLRLRERKEGLLGRGVLKLWGTKVGEASLP